MTVRTIGPGPTIELQGGGRGVLVREADPDTGLTVVHARRQDFLDDWHAKSLITGEQLDVARDFQRQFRAAGFGARYRSVLDAIVNTKGRGHSGGENISRVADAEMWIKAALASLGAQQQSVVISILGQIPGIKPGGELA